ncbi:MAG: hypothetical protein AAGA95_21280, partial [Pseudomonadota bacterium]
DLRGNLSRAEDLSPNELVNTGSSFYEYDAAGNRIRIETDSDGDGQTDWTHTYSYDVSGKLLRETRLSSGSSPSTESVTTYRYNSAGLRTVLEQDLGADGSADNISSIYYDDDGRITRVTQVFSEDEIPGSETTYLYDAAGREIQIRSSGLLASPSLDGRRPPIGYGPEDQFDPTLPYGGSSAEAALISISPTPQVRVTRFYWNAAGHIARRETDEGEDGSIDSITSYEYDEDAKLIRWRHDRNGDGSFEDVARYTYDNAGRPIRVDDKLPAQDSVRLIEYGGDGRRSTITTETVGGSLNDGVVRFIYDELGNPSQTTWDADADGAPETTQTQEWEASDRMDVNTNRKI